MKTAEYIEVAGAQLQASVCQVGPAVATSRNREIGRCGAVSMPSRYYRRLDMTASAYGWLYRVANYKGGQQIGIMRMFDFERDAVEAAQAMARGLGVAVNEIDWRSRFPVFPDGICIETQCFKNPHGTERERVFSMPWAIPASIIA